MKPILLPGKPMLCERCRPLLNKFEWKNPQTCYKIPKPCSAVVKTGKKLPFLSVCEEGGELTEVIINAPKDAFKTQLGDPDGSKAKPDSNTTWTGKVVPEDAEEQPYIEATITDDDGKPVKKLVAVEADGNIRVR
jgi:hypothetical protein